MKQVTMESVKQRIDDLESAGKVVGGLSLSSEFELACLRELVAVTEQRDAAIAAERVWETTMMEACGEDGPASVAAEIKALREKRDAVVAENAVKQEFIATCFRAAGDGCDMDWNDIQELGERLGLFERQTYQPALHGYICGHEAGEDSVYVMKVSPATDAEIAALRAEGVEMLRDSLSEIESGVEDTIDLRHYCSDFARQLRESKGEVSNG